MTARSNHNRGTAGRHDLARVPDPAAGYPVLPTTVHNRTQIAPVAIPDPYDPRRRARAVARIDLLDRERRAGKLTEAAFLAGREVERMFESMSRIRGSAWLDGDRVDATTSRDMAMVLGAENAIKVNNYLAWMLRNLGKPDTRLLWFILGNRLSFATAACSLGRPGVRGLRYTIDRFRDALATLADAKAARGRASR